MTTDDSESAVTAALVLFQGLNNPLLLGPRRDDRVVALLVDAIVRVLDPAAGA